jgi:hypothetical protein
MSFIDSIKDTAEEVSTTLGILETGYIAVSDCYNEADTTVTTSRTKSILSGLSKGRTKKINESKIIKVQFNPESLSFRYSGAGKHKDKASISGSDNGVAAQEKAEEESDMISVSMKLVFDRSRYYIDKSVQPEVEQFLAIIKKHYSRGITFYWGTVSYTGIVRNVNAEYVLFNALGIPTRANVDLTMMMTEVE